MGTAPQSWSKYRTLSYQIWSRLSTTVTSLPLVVGPSSVKIILTFCNFILDWIRQHPECTFNCFNSPHLRPAFLLDRVFFYFSVDVDLGLWVEDGIPKG